MSDRCYPLEETDTTPSAAPEKEYVYAEAANGMEVRISKDKYAQWKETQDRIRRGEKVETDPQMRERLISRMLGKSNSENSDKKCSGNNGGFPIYERIKEIHSIHNRECKKINQEKCCNELKQKLILMWVSLFELVSCFILHFFSVYYIISLSIAAVIWFLIRCKLHIKLEKELNNKYAINKSNAVKNMKSVLSNNTLLQAVGVPSNIEFGQHFPINEGWENKKWVCYSGEVYHDNRYCPKLRDGYPRPYHALVVVKYNRRPCMFCGTPIVVPEWYNRYNELCNILLMYDFKVNGNGTWESP